MTQPRILMCPPDHYGIHYEINPWMNKERQVDHQTSVSQWQALKTALETAGAKIEQLTPIEGLPDLVFTANAGLVFHNRIILARFRHEQRAGEEAHDAAWFESNGFTVEQLPQPHYFEGAGDALFCGDTLFCGYQLRSDAIAHQKVGEMISARVIPVELVDPYYYHIDTCFCPLNTDTAIYFPGAFDDYGRRAIAELIPNLIEVPENEAREFACNAVVVGNTVVTNVGCEVMHQRLQQSGFQTVGTPLNEFVKAGGSAKCLTLRLDGEEAASWKY